MTRVRLGLAAALVALVAGGTVAASAVAATGGAPSASSVPALHRIQVHGAAKGGKKFTGTYAIQRFTVATVNGKKAVYAVGTLTGTLKGQHVSRSNVMLPAKLTGASSKTQTSTKSTRQAAQCTVLHLVLGPINLDLLGLNVTLGGGTITPGSPATQPI